MVDWQHIFGVHWLKYVVQFDRPKAIKGDDTIEAAPAEVGEIKKTLSVVGPMVDQV